MVEMKPAKERATKGVMFTGAHHARELTSIQMNVYLILKTVYLHETNHTETLRLFKYSALYFIPFVNIDGVKYISEQFNKTGQLRYIRKNRNDGKNDGYQACKDDDYFGVDLNRNYDYSFASSDIGSSGDPCGEDYRGPHAFSEPETKAIKVFVESHSDIVMSFNFHAWGNLPFQLRPISIKQYSLD